MKLLTQDLAIVKFMRSMRFFLYRKSNCQD